MGLHDEGSAGLCVCVVTGLSGNGVYTVMRWSGCGSAMLWVCNVMRLLGYVFVWSWVCVVMGMYDYAFVGCVSVLFGLCGAKVVWLWVCGYGPVKLWVCRVMGLYGDASLG